MDNSFTWREIVLLLNRPRITGAIICSIIVAQLSVHSALGACPVTPSTLGNGVIEEPVTCPGAAGGNAAVGMDGQGRFTIAWEQPRGFGPSGSDPIDIFIRRFDSDGDDLEEPLAITYQIDNDHIHHDVSVDMSYDGLVLTGWVVKNPSSIVTIQDTILAYVFEFDDTTLDSLGAQSASRGDFEASVGIGDISSEVAGITWSSRTGSEFYPKGLTYQVTNELPEAIRTCTSGGICAGLLDGRATSPCGRTGSMLLHGPMQRNLTIHFRLSI
ncbi:MAG: hypothetical protein IPK83_06475 [Planctomycetes bacterium]|nr:hypothetical protein [Planctomycetota bacterium]